MVKTSDETEKAGRYGKFGGQFVPETLMTALIELEEAYDKAMEGNKRWPSIGSVSRKSSIKD